MKIKGLIDEDFTNYKKPSMFISFPWCTFKCEKECGLEVCQNSILSKAPVIEASPKSIIERYKSNPITSAIVCGGLDPIDSFDELLLLLQEFRKESIDDFVVYTGYNKEEILDKVVKLSEFENVIIKFGRFIPNAKHRIDEVLGIELASDNQYAEKIS